jgi:predicted nuclease of restriction endonuclease-like (RecB) superfamily
MTKSIAVTRYQKVIREIEETIAEAQQEFIRSANCITIELYWKLGKLLANCTEDPQQGQQIFSRLAFDLTKIVSNATCYSEVNLRRMRQFYYDYTNYPELLDLTKNVSWSTNLSIINKVNGAEARKFYLKMASDSLCSRDAIELEIKSQAYERNHVHDKKHNFQPTLPAQLTTRPDNLLKTSHFIMEVAQPFISSKALLEKQSEMELSNHIKEIIMLLGKGFSFIGNQYRIAAKDNEYYINLLFFNRIFRSLFCVELKTDKFEVEYAGKMNLHLKLLDEHVKQPEENPSIGLILYTDHNSIEVDYALRDLNTPADLAEIKLSKILPNDFIGKLPDPQELKNEILYSLEHIDNTKNNS